MSVGTEKIWNTIDFKWLSWFVNSFFSFLIWFWRRGWSALVVKSLHQFLPLLSFHFPYVLFHPPQKIISRTLECWLILTCLAYVTDQNNRVWKDLLSSVIKETNIIHAFSHIWWLWRWTCLMLSFFSLYHFHILEAEQGEREPRGSRCIRLVNPVSPSRQSW